MWQALYKDPANHKQLMSPTRKNTSFCSRGTKVRQLGTQAMQQSTLEPSETPGGELPDVKSFLSSQEDLQMSPGIILQEGLVVREC